MLGRDHFPAMKPEQSLTRSSKELESEPGWPALLELESELELSCISLGVPGFKSLLRLHL